jgi:serine/threonine protein kinase
MVSTWTSSPSESSARAASVSPTLIIIKGYVFEAYDRAHKQTVAVKRTTKAGEYVSREFEVLDKLRECNNVIKLLDIYYSKNEEGKTAQNLVFEFCKTNLEEVIQ